MPYTYDVGVSTPGLAGLIELTGTTPLIRINSASPTLTSTAGGTFKLESCGLFDAPPVDMAVNAYPNDDGGALGPQFYGPWQFTIVGWLWVPSGPDDVAPAEEQLKAAFSPKNGLMALSLNKRGWSSALTTHAQTNGPVTFTPRHGTLRVPTRDFQIPMVAPDPTFYGY